MSDGHKKKIRVLLCPQPDRSISASVLAGERWITNKHVVGNPGGNGLTPTPDETLAAETEGRIVAYLPGSGLPTRQLFALNGAEKVLLA